MSRFSVFWLSRVWADLSMKASPRFKAGRVSGLAGPTRPRHLPGRGTYPDGARYCADAAKCGRSDQSDRKHFWQVTLHQGGHSRSAPEGCADFLARYDAMGPVSDAVRFAGRLRHQSAPFYASV